MFFVSHTLPTKEVTVPESLRDVIWHLPMMVYTQAGLPSSMHIPRNPLFSTQEPLQSSKQETARARPYLR